MTHNPDPAPAALGLLAKAWIAITILSLSVGLIVTPLLDARWLGFLVPAGMWLALLWPSARRRGWI